jgi:hypothetical protein
MTMSMTPALASLSKFFSKFFHEGLPIALASVVAAMLVGQYTRLPASTPIVVQSPPLPGAQAKAQALSDEHELILELLKRDAEVKRVTDAAQEDGSKTGKLGASAQERPARARIVTTERILPQPPARPTADKKLAAREPRSTVPTPVAVASTLGEVEERFVEEAVSENPDLVGGVRGWVANAAQLPGRLWAAAYRPLDEAPRPRMPGQVVRAVRGIVANAAHLPAQLWGAADQQNDQAPTPPMSVPDAGLTTPQADVSHLSQP